MKKKIGLICEGGGTKAAYTCGVLQCFLDENINFPYTVGISAGAEVLVARPGAAEYRGGPGLKSKRRAQGGRVHPHLKF